MQDLNDLYYFVQVVDHGGFAAAGRALGLPKSKLSRRIGVLEDRLGVRLIQRSSRRFSVTDIGQEFHRQCLAMLVEAEAAQAIIDNVRTAPQGTIRMTCPPGLLAYHIGEAVARFLVANPRIEIQLKALNRRVDVIGEGYDLAVRAETSLAEPATLVTRKLGETSHCLVVAPALLADRPTIAAPPGLAELPSIDFGLTHPDHPQGRHEWRLRDGDGNVATVPHRPRLVTDDLASLRAAAIAGVGVAQLPSLMVHPDITAGRLVDVLPGWRPHNTPVHALFPSRRGLLPSIRALLDFLGRECAPYRDGTMPHAETTPS